MGYEALERIYTHPAHGQHINTSQTDFRLTLDIHPPIAYIATMPKTKYDILNDVNEAMEWLPDAAETTQILEDIQNHIKRGTYKKDFDAAHIDPHAYKSWVAYIDEEVEVILNAMYEAESKLEFMQKEIRDVFDNKNIIQRRKDQSWK